MLKRIVKTSFFSIGSRGFMTAANLVIMMAVSKKLSGAKLGIYSITAFLYYLFAFLTSFELTTYLGKEVAHRRDDVKEKEKLMGEIGTTLLLGLGLSALTFLGLWLFYKQISFPLLLLSAVSGIIFGLEKNLSGVLLGEEKMHLEFIAQLTAFLMTAVPVYFFIHELDLTGIYVLRIAASVVGVLLRGRFTDALKLLKRTNISLKKYNWKEIKFFSISGLSYFIQHHIDLFILSILVSRELEGAYFLALRVYLSFNLLAEMISLALTPFISRIFQGKDGSNFDAFYNGMLQVQMVMGALAAVVLYFTRDVFVLFFAKDVSHRLVSEFLMYFSFLLFFRFVSYFTGNVLSATRFQEVRFYILVNTAALMITLEIVLGKFFSVYGIIYSRAVVEAVIFCSYLWVIWKIRSGNEAKSQKM